MRAHLSDRKPFRNIKVCYEVTGLNQDRLIEQLKKRDIAVYDLKKFNNRVMRISVNLNQSAIFFAITKELCYNIKKIRLKGKTLPVYELVKNLGLVIGACAFLALTVISNDFLFGFSFSGTGSVYKREVLEYLANRGIVKYSRFSDIELERLEDEILKDNDKLTFVSVQKKGNILSVYTTLKTDGAQTLSGSVAEMKADRDGVIDSIKVYRGTAVVKVGDSVKAGDLLVAGYAEIKEQIVDTGVIAYITLIESRQFVYTLTRDKQGEYALMLAEQELSGKEIVGSSVGVINNGKQYEYTVNIDYKSVLYAG